MYGLQIGISNFHLKQVYSLYNVVPVSKRTPTGYCLITLSPVLRNHLFIFEDFLHNGIYKDS